MDIPMWRPSDWWMGSETMSSHCGCRLNSLASFPYAPCPNPVNIWRCTVSDYDIIGPYFSSAGGLGAKFILATLFETMHVFQLYGFKTKAIVCDGASPNLSSIKTLQHVCSLLRTVVWLQCLEHIMQGSKLIRGHAKHMNNIKKLNPVELFRLDTEGSWTIPNPRSASWALVDRV